MSEYDNNNNQPGNIAGLAAALVTDPPASGSTAYLPHTGITNTALLGTITTNLNAGLGDPHTAPLPDGAGDQDTNNIGAG